MKHLCDINVWLALSLVNHRHHSQTIEWFDQLGQSDIACFCRVTQQGFLRLTTNKAVFGALTLTNRAALQVYRKFLTDSRVAWLDEPAHIEAKWFEFAAVDRSSPDQWMDAYLAAFAVLTESRLVTFDKGFRIYKELDWINLNELK